MSAPDGREGNQINISSSICFFFLLFFTTKYTQFSLLFLGFSLDLYIEYFPLCFYVVEVFFSLTNILVKFESFKNINEFKTFKST